MKVTKIIYNTISILGVLFSGCFIVICWIEYYTVGILNNTKEYPFGGEGPVPYYYKSSEMYPQVNLIWGIIFSLNFILLITSLIKRKRTFRILMLILTWILIVIIVIQGSIGVI